MSTEPPAQGTQSELQALSKERSFVLYQLIRLISVTAMQMLSVSTAWEVYGRTGRPESLGYVGLAQFTPQILLVLFTGAAADRFDRRKVLALCHLTIVLAACLFAWASTRPDLGAAPFYAVQVLFGIARAFAGPSGQAITPSLVPASLFARAVAVGAMTFQIGVVIGPALGGALVQPLGVSNVYMLVAALELTIVCLLPFVKPYPQVAEVRVQGESAWQRLIAGMAFVRRRRTLLGAISLDLFAVILGGATALMPVYARDILHVEGWGFGALRSAPAVGALAVALYLGLRPLKARAGVLMLVCVGIFGVATIVFGVSENFFVSVLALIVLGGADMVSVVVRHVIVQGQTPDAMRGRVSAVNMVFIGASNELGELESGLLAGAIGTVPAVVVGGVGTILVTALWAHIFPELRRVERPDEVQA